MRYEIVTSRYAHEVTERVNQLLDEGWKLYGELKFTAYFVGQGSEHVWMFAQAMIRKEKKRKNDHADV